jgi:hypothetical protein
MIEKPDVLIFVEDPGAANLVIGLPEKLSQFGYSGVILAAGPARDYLLSHQESCLEIHSDQHAGSLLEQYSPVLMVCGTSENPDSLGLQLIAAFRSRGITSIGLVDAAMNAEYRFRGRSSNPLACRPDRIFVTGHLTAEHFINLGVSKQDVVVIANPVFSQLTKVKQKLEAKDRVSERIRIFGEEVSKRKVICFLTEKSDGLDLNEFFHSDTYTLSGRGQTKERTKIVLEELLDECKKYNQELEVVLRLHPKETLKEYQEYFDEVAISDPAEHALSVVFFADAVIGLTTTLLEEARQLGCRTLSIVPREKEKKWVPFPPDHIDKTVCSRIALSNALEKILFSEWSNQGQVITEDTPHPSVSQLLVELLLENEKKTKVDMQIYLADLTHDTK